jgi:hypothetical protein
MATLTTARSDVFPVGTTVSVRAVGAKRDGQAPVGPELASGTVDAAGLLSITDSDIVSGTAFALYALVGAEHRYLIARSTLDLFDSGRFVATGDTTSGQPTIANASASSGTIQAGMRISGAGIRPGTFIQSVSGGTLTLTATATATATGVTLHGEGAYTWRARMRRRRIAIGTS